MTAADPDSLLAWYDRHARRLPWRVPPDEHAVGVVPDPYRVWLSEIMLQQTTVAAVIGYFDAFLARWPTVQALASAPAEEVMKAWAGLGYYSRARNLKAAAEEVARTHGGRFPDTEEGLRGLPGVGAYTAAAIAAIAFDRPAVVVDGNVERVIARLFEVETPLPAAKAEIRRLTGTLTPKDRPGDFAQAMMDLGATICTPRRPACALCPWSPPCRSRAAGTAETLPRKAAKAERPHRRGAAFVAVRSDGAVLLRRRPDRGLLGGMTEVPGTEWSEVDPAMEHPPIRLKRPDRKAPARGVDSGAISNGPDESVRSESAPAAGPAGFSWRGPVGSIEHTFTHFHLTLSVHRADAAAGHPAPDGHWWSRPEDLPGEALPTVMRKVVEAALPGTTKRTGRR